MKERRYVKLRSDMYEDTKAKIIDMKPERDLIHYVWNRLVVLAGKVNLEGELYLSKNIAYTIETLAIEFNRDINIVKLALDVLIELEMLELTKDNIYSVKNFAKHQNIKVKEKINPTYKEDYINKKEVQPKGNLANEIHDNKVKESENKTSQNQVNNVRNNGTNNFEIIPKDINKAYNNINVDNNRSSENINNNSQDNIPILLETKKTTRVSKKNKKDMLFDITEDEIDDNPLICFYDNDEERPLGEGERVVKEWSFGSIKNYV